MYLCFAIVSLTFHNITEYSVKTQNICENIFMEIEILPHTERFLLIFNKLKAERKLPSNSVLAKEIGMNSGNTLTEIKGRRQNIALAQLKKFCDLFGDSNGFSFESIIGESANEKSVEKSNPVKEGDSDWNSAAIKALTWKLADALSEISELKGDPRPAGEYLQELDRSTTRILAHQYILKKK